MTWVRHTDQRTVHRCPAPTAGSFGSPDGQLGDLWRCGDCDTLWRIGKQCSTCDRYGDHAGCMGIGDTWRPARLWQRLAHWRKGRA